MKNVNRFRACLETFGYLSSRARNERGDPVGYQFAQRDCFSLDITRDRNDVD